MVLGCRFGWLELGDAEAIVTTVREPDGRATRFKFEGIESRADGPSIFDVVADMDRPDEPAVIAELHVVANG